MKQVAKLVLINKNNEYLMLFRSNHPVFGNDPDLPGGTIEGDETDLRAVVREVEEEAGITVDESKLSRLYSGTDYSKSGTNYSLFKANLEKNPVINLSWEHSSYQWLDRDNFLKLAAKANDSYMLMVYDKLKD